MRTESELIAVANQNYIGAYRKLVEHCHGGEVLESGGVFAFVTGLPHAVFNGCVVAEPAAPEALDTAITWVADRELPFRVWVAQALAPSLDPVLVRRGLGKADRPYPGMVLHPVPEPPPPSVGVTVDAVPPSGLEDFLGRSIDTGMPPTAARQLFSPSFAADPNVRLFIARLDGRPVGTSVAIRSGEVSGIYAVGTVPDARRHGVGSALTWAAVDAGRAWGCDTIVLQASEMGFPIYAGMGFRTVVDYAVYSVDTMHR